jgi:hypothetical protein
MIPLTARLFFHWSIPLRADKEYNKYLGFWYRVQFRNQFHPVPALMVSFKGTVAPEEIGLKVVWLDRLRRDKVSRMVQGILNRAAIF